MQNHTIRTTSIYQLGHGKDHNVKNIWMLMETTSITIGLGALTLWGYNESLLILVWLCVFLQGCWMQRIYCVGHESAHRKLFPQNTLLNNIIGQLFLWVLLVPLSIFQKIHDFHHAANRRDIETSALDVYKVPANPNRLQRLWPQILWFAGILCGGWFIHSLISILLFLMLPVSIARKVSPAFKGWTLRNQISAGLCFFAPFSIHFIAVKLIGIDRWVLCYLCPFAIFAIVYSLQLYVYHYRTTIGPKTLYHARRLSGPKWISWWLLNLNEHDTHHQRPKIVWYALPDSHKPLPVEFAHNQNVQTYFEGLRQQFKGPTLIEREP
jgi:fatty acid desaturase